MDDKLVKKALGEIMKPPIKIDEQELKDLKDKYATKLIDNGFDKREPYNFLVMEKYMALFELGACKKGLCLFGPPGRGKTIGLQLLSKFFNLKWFDSKDLPNQYRKEPKKFSMLIKEQKWKGGSWDGYSYYSPSIVIDDLGAEVKLKYGGEWELLTDIVADRASLYDKDYRVKTFFTTNLTPEMLEERYGSRVTSRLSGMCNMIAFKGDDRRKTGNVDFE